MKITRKQLLIGGVCVIATCTLSFFAYKKVKKILEDNQVEELDQEEVEQEIADRQLKIALAEQEELRKLRNEALEEWAQADLDEEEDSNEEEKALNSIFYGWTKEELGTLRYDKDSKEALEQYKAMSLADVHDENSLYVMNMMFDIPLRLYDEADNALLNIQDNRYEFFGDSSVHSNDATIAELLLYLAKLLQFDLNYTTDRSIRMFMKNLGWANRLPYEEEFHDVAEMLMDFDYYNPDTGDFGLFALVDKVQDDGSDMTTWIQQYWAYVAVEMEIETMEESNYDEQFDTDVYEEDEEED